MMTTRINYHAVVGVTFLLVGAMALSVLLRSNWEKEEMASLEMDSIAKQYSALQFRFQVLLDFKNKLEESFERVQLEKAKLESNMKEQIGKLKEENHLVVEVKEKLDDEMKKRISHFNEEINRIQQHLNSCLRREEQAMAMRNQEIIPKVSKNSVAIGQLTSNETGLSDPKEENKVDSRKGRGSFKASDQSFAQIQPSGDPNIDPAGNIFV